MLPGMRRLRFLSVMFACISLGATCSALAAAPVPDTPYIALVHSLSDLQIDRLTEQADFLTYCPGLHGYRLLRRDGTMGPKQGDLDFVYGDTSDTVHYCSIGRSSFLVTLRSLAYSRVAGALAVVEQALRRNTLVCTSYDCVEGSDCSVGPPTARELLSSADADKQLEALTELVAIMALLPDNTGGFALQTDRASLAEFDRHLDRLSRDLPSGVVESLKIVTVPATSRYALCRSTKRAQSRAAQLADQVAGQVDAKTKRLAAEAKAAAAKLQTSSAPHRMEPRGSIGH